jgi:hypothetical protein
LDLAAVSTNNSARPSLKPLGVHAAADFYGKSTGVFVNTNVTPLTTVSRGGDAVQFEIEMRGKKLTCSITREALEDHFWLGRQANEVRLLRAFSDGRKRIVAMAERKARRLATEVIKLTSQDFER